MSGAARAIGGRVRVDFGMLSPLVGVGGLFALSGDNLTGWQGNARGKETAAVA